MSSVAGSTLIASTVSSLSFGSAFSITNSAGGCLQVIAVTEGVNPFSYVGAANNLQLVTENEREREK